MITIATSCPFCHDISLIEVNEDDFNRWEEGEHTQDVFPYLSASDRERLITGICPECWERMFPAEEEKSWELMFPVEEEEE